MSETIVQDAINITHIEASAKGEVIKAEYAVSNAQASQKIVSDAIVKKTAEVSSLRAALASVRALISEREARRADIAEATLALDSQSKQYPLPKMMSEAEASRAATETKRSSLVQQKCRAEVALAANNTATEASIAAMARSATARTHIALHRSAPTATGSSSSQCLGKATCQFYAAAHAAVVAAGEEEAARVAATKRAEEEAVEIAAIKARIAEIETATATAAAPASPREPRTLSGALMEALLESASAEVTALGSEQTAALATRCRQVLFESESAQTAAAILLAMRRYVDETVTPSGGANDGPVCVYCWDAATAADVGGEMAIGEGAEATLAQ